MTGDFEKYGTSENGNFKVIDSIPTKHPYCITAKHVGHCADNHGGILGKEAILDAERDGIRCGVRNCNLTYEQHENALLVECKIDFKAGQKELHVYLLKNKEQCEKDGFAGFAFIKSKDFVGEES